MAERIPTSHLISVVVTTQPTPLHLLSIELLGLHLVHVHFLVDLLELGGLGPGPHVLLLGALLARHRRTRALNVVHQLLNTLRNLVGERITVVVTNDTLFVGDYSPLRKRLNVREVTERLLEIRVRGCSTLSECVKTTSTKCISELLDVRVSHVS